MDKAYMESVQNALVHTYNPAPIVLDHGEGAYLYDTEGKAYLDFAAGYAVNSLGYGNEEWNQALKSQIDHLAHTSNLYYHTRTKEAAEALKRVSGMDRIFFCNSGGEAIEGALKASRKYAYTKKSGRYEWIAMEESFHGRGFGAVSVTGHKAYQEPFEPLVPGVRFAKYNDLESVKELVTDKTCAIILEPVQGEGGINVATEEFLTGIRRICDENDILTMAKAIGNGFPVGAFALTEKVAECSLNPGDHGTTYGGGPLACAAVAKTVEIYEREHLPEHTAKIGAYLRKQLENLAGRHTCIVSCKGKGLMQGIQLSIPLADVTKKALDRGLLLIGAGSDVIRFVPPLIITEKEVDELIRILDEILE